MNVAGLSQNNIYLAIFKYGDCRDKTIPKDIRKETYLKDLENQLEIQKFDSHNLKKLDKKKEKSDF